MKNLFKFLLVLVFIFTLFVIRYSSITVRASEDNPIPPRPIIPCDPTSVDDPEFDSLRPYQSHPCGTAPQSKFCGNKIIITESKTESKTFPATQGCDPTKQVNWVNDKDYWIDMTDLELPILGNTQDVQNSQNGDDKLDNSQKMNEYASWYLNGVINRAEYGDTNNTAAELINFSGPINKLMPSVILEAQRIETIKNPKDEENGPKESSSHNQIVVCGKETTFGLIGNLLDLGKTVPVECYLQSGDKYRLVDDKKPLSKNRSWEGDLSFWNSYVDSVVGFIVSFLPDIAEDVIRKSVLEHWNSRIPPLPWEKDPHTGEEPMTNLKYRKYYNEWKGKTCVVVPLINYLACFENIFVPNRYADLYPYVPLANTSDKHYPIPINTVTIQGSGSVDITSKSWDVLKDGLPLLYYPHAIEVKELSDFLNKTYLTGDPSENVDTKTSEINSYNPTDPEQCRIINVRSNEGDNLFPIGGDGEHDIGVHVYFEVDELPLVACIPFTDPISGEDKVRGKYYGEVAIEIHTDPVQVPNADQIWKSTVSSETSTFRRIFPKVEKGAPVECIADIPGVSKVAYTPIEGTDEIGVKSLTNPEVKYDPLEARLHFPHLGTVYEYFLKGIQTALRPKGYGTPIINGTLCDSNDIPCGELPDLPQASGSCALGGVSSKVGSIPPTFKEILEAAAETYKTPPNLILGVMYGEGAFNS
ncbi:MAG TPA: hypothetical protein VI795_00350, partial [Patescibacteria group bacterium]|nr:hypothetical protein [Patescibacteria group bacterium]